MSSKVVDKRNYCIAEIYIQVPKMAEYVKSLCGNICKLVDVSLYSSWLWEKYEPGSSGTLGNANRINRI